MTQPALTTEERRLTSHVLLVRGVVAVGLGLVAVFWPDVTVKVVAVLVGLLVALMGLATLGESFARRRDGDAWVGTLIAGLVLAGVGVAAVVWPGPTVQAIAVLFGIGFVVSGLVTVIESFVARKDLPGWGFFAFWGLIVAGFGAVIISWPDITVGVLVVLTGITWIISGVVSVLASRQVTKSPASA